MTKKKNPHIGSSLNDLLKEEGVLEQFRNAAAKEVIAWQIEQEMKAKDISKNAFAKLMGTSRTQIDRLLDPTLESTTIDTLERAAKILGRELRIELR
ncbi:helix-turn-helix domain-containing protein [Hyphomicrobium sp.]|jgi:predicted XRE-type DNA-binding protein|uniref:helix-turn-helix domain-containing protein n=1 Tax=Hyphomicrobium sp. TaxID=82 RepID=UPI0035679BDD